MAGRRDDSTGDRTPATPADDDGGRPAGRRSAAHTAGLAVGLLMAVGATVAVLASDDPLHLRIGLLAACWAFLVAAFLAGGRRADQLAAQAREAELRHAYEIELEREVAARAAYERDLEQRLRRESEQGVLRELADLRAGLSGLSGLRADLAGLGELRADLGRLRGELAEQLSGELLIERMVMRAQAVRLPGEGAADGGRTLDGVTATGGPVSGSWELHTTVARWTGDGEPAGPSAGAPPARSLRPIPSRTPPRPPAPGDESTLRQARLDDEPAAGAPPVGASPIRASPVGASPVGTSSPADVAVGAVPPAALPVPEVERPVPVRESDLPVEEVAPTVAVPAEPVNDPAVVPAVVPAGPVEEPAVVAPSPPGVGSVEPSPAASASAADRPVPGSRHRVGLESASGGPAAAPRRHRRAAEPDDAPPVAAAGAAASTGSPGSPTEAPVTAEPPGTREPADAARPRPAPGAAGAAPGHARLEQILAGSGVAPAEGRRRRRYRDETDPEPADDVLARVLGHTPPV
ncbi:DUF6779 domain-containing protein [Modestobacter sp. URMC 112]